VDAIFRQAQAQERAYNAKLAELEYKKAIGELVSAADVQAELSRIFATFREAMQQIPNRLAAVLAAETDQARVHDALDVEIRNALMHLKERV
jgi:phage terminase Nu1 subunit (DNA packaging protein)